MLIGIVGIMGSGKSTLTEFLVKEFGFIEKSFAKSLKEVAKILNLYNDDFLQKMGFKSPRDALQRLGDGFRLIFSEEFWIMQAEREVMASLYDGLDIVISDVRYPNELEWIKLLGGYIIGINVSTKVAYTRSKKRGAIKDKDMTVSEFYRYSKHSSEKNIDLLLTLADCIIDGDHRLEYFLLEGKRKVELLKKEEERKKNDING